MTIKNRVQKLEEISKTGTPNVSEQLTNREILQIVAGDCPPELAERLSRIPKSYAAKVHECRWEEHPEFYGPMFERNITEARRLLETLPAEILDSCERCEEIGEANNSVFSEIFSSPPRIVPDYAIMLNDGRAVLVTENDMKAQTVPVDSLPADIEIRK